MTAPKARLIMVDLRGRVRFDFLTVVLYKPLHSFQKNSIMTRLSVVNSIHSKVFFRKKAPHSSRTYLCFPLQACNLLLMFVSSPGNPGFRPLWVSRDMKLESPELHGTGNPGFRPPWVSRDMKLESPELHGAGNPGFRPPWVSRDQVNLG